MLQSFWLGYESLFKNFYDVAFKRSFLRKEPFETDPSGDSNRKI